MAGHVSLHPLLSRACSSHGAGWGSTRLSWTPGRPEEEDPGSWTLQGWGLCLLGMEAGPGGWEQFITAIPLPLQRLLLMKFYGRWK